ncbi:MAG: hypothetical protein R3A10_10175 [Caldilineaceae bacterium]
MTELEHTAEIGLQVRAASAPTLLPASRTPCLRWSASTPDNEGRRHATHGLRRSAGCGESAGRLVE